MMSGASENLEQVQRLTRHVHVLAGLIGVRHDSRPSTIAAAVGMIEREWAAMGQAVETQRYDTPAGVAKNLVVEWPGATRPEEIVVVGAHYDTVRTTPGADDNASAVAVLLETTRALAGRRFARTVRFVAFANEEPPHFISPTMGSRVYAKRCRAAQDQIICMVCLEMMGYFVDVPGSQAYPAELPAILRKVLPDRGDFLACVSDRATRRPLKRFARAFRKASPLKLVAHAIPEAQNLLWVSDHGPFWDERYPALMLTDTSYFRNPHYHEVTDTPETLDYPAMSRATDGVVAGVAALAGEE